MSFNNIYESELTEEETPRGLWRFLDLSGSHLGVRLEQLEPGETSSISHYHTREEEHVIALEGNATLVLDGEHHPFKRGDHVCFKAGDEVGHHFRNDSGESCRLLVIGERKRGDVCIYPEEGVATIRALNSGWKQFDIKQREKTLYQELQEK